MTGLEVSVDDSSGRISPVMYVLRGQHADGDHRETKRNDEQQGRHSHRRIIAGNRLDLRRRCSAGAECALERDKSDFEFSGQRFVRLRRSLP
jgi:hypothetical protein